jgi:hypothetical protein
LIWKLQKVYDENPDCGLGFPDLVKIKYREARFSFQGQRAFPLRILQQTPVITNKKTELKGENHVGSQRDTYDTTGSAKTCPFSNFPFPEDTFDTLGAPRKYQLSYFFPCFVEKT